jgi:hypothetical protein
MGQEWNEKVFPSHTLSILYRPLVGACLLLPPCLSYLQIYFEKSIVNYRVIQYPLLQH